MTTKTYDFMDDVLIYHSCTSQSQKSSFEALRKSCKVSIEEAQERYSEILNGDKNYLKDVETFLAESTHGMILHMLDALCALSDKVNGELDEQP